MASAALALAFTIAALPASAQTVQRSIDEFAAAQGTFCFPDGGGGCLLFVPPVENFVGWTDTKNFLGASVDYAGLADDALGGILGTTFSGTVKTVRCHPSSSRTATRDHCRAVGERVGRR